MMGLYWYFLLDSITIPWLFQGYLHVKLTCVQTCLGTNIEVSVGKP